ncbi:alpha/beta fold hydrolase [Hyphomicrobium sp.]|uniref:alpha/beta fold hydrolase n=1 Tax=Hyphomicrobium sp. TaxID=82 RepID=UPI0025BBCDB7|nr:alpha/beta fold hydrolase [Hyphomicrobium sp.]MCC7252217.1 alpha/beta fold hydrolase [Hyphomicrobium sp.]
MQDEDTSLRSIAGFVVMFGVLPCALFLAGVYLYILYFRPLPYAGVELQPNIVYVSARRFETHGLERLSANGTSIDLAPLTARSLGEHLKPTVTVLVHGYNAQEHKVATYFAGLTSYLLADGKYDGSIVVFDWPALGVPLDELPTAQRVQFEMMAKNRPYQPGYELGMYGIDQRRAADVGARSFLDLLKALTTTENRTINVIGHSMGCYLLAEALKRDPETSSEIAIMNWLAPDIDEAVVEEPWLHTAVGRLRGGIHVYYSRHDTVLTRHSRIANGTARLGATGAGTAHKPPDGMEFVDMTEDLGTGNPHAGYLADGSPSLQRIARQISAAANAKP